ncbi:hypothetical protein BCR41DRAFT_368610 [Lobosporangium transversale]|uniref:Methyltransferase domain-containing protein n=1 Tax=Lobosporangium transversale TaxID=64571 RepID=A0A1Y2GX14_9FUNG|nr:hypothetical protein BCR41DRAFT_368610 [Lobosporangium transversale]ORZ24777.1 hypothetical protein BCR41DRAFT_368610 [Lobosporangium transversale]|eukprot:XP_021883758.1 hypothetical protein BCR41DRAFT_368610 [Lobosporangium transversale]
MVLKKKKKVYTVEQHLTRALFKGQNYSAPLDFSKHSDDERHLQQQNQDGELTHEKINRHDSLCDEAEAEAEEEEEEEEEEEGHQPIILQDNDHHTDCDDNKELEPELASRSHSRSSSLSSSCSMTTPNHHRHHHRRSPMVIPPPKVEDERSLVILSVGCGNTQWATEMALAHPQSAVHAINVSQIPSLPAVPETTPSFDLENLFFYNLDENSLQIPFVSNSVDYIHVRRFLPNISKTKYLTFLRELVRVLKVDGYLELVELDSRLRDSGVDSCWPSYWTLIGFDKLGIDTSLALNLGGILRTMPGMEVTHKSSVNMPVGLHGGRVGLASELLWWRCALNVRPWLMRQAMLSGSEFDEMLERARQEMRTLKSYQVYHVAVGRKTAGTAAAAAAGGRTTTTCATPVTSATTTIPHPSMMVSSASAPVSSSKGLVF